MRLALYLKAVGVWFGFAVMAVLVAAVRESTLEPTLGELRAHQLATLIVCVLVLAGIGAFVFVVSLSPRDARRVGLFWLAVSIWFEFLFGRYVVGVPWERLLADYNLFRGRLLLLLWLTLLAGPIVIARLWRRRTPAPAHQPRRDDQA